MPCWRLLLRGGQECTPYTDFFKERLRRSFREVVALASGGGHTLRCRDLRKIVAWHRDGVSDGGHDGNVMKMMDGRAGVGWWENPTQAKRRLEWGPA